MQLHNDIILQTTYYKQVFVFNDKEVYMKISFFFVVFCLWVDYPLVMGLNMEISLYDTLIV